MRITEIIVRYGNVIKIKKPLDIKRKVELGGGPTASAAKMSQLDQFSSIAMLTGKYILNHRFSYRH